ncbi:MAG: type I restriction-modification system subunit M, partial [Lachnospiraceae bacterium]|nr:type I restriction-modification system subunit M [Lachnospiraceae bacterium]
MNKQQLASNIWALANELRGKVPAATYKDYMLGFLFYKYLSDKEESYLINRLDYSKDELAEVTEEDDQIKKYCMDNLGFFISHKNLFSTWIKMAEEFSIGNVTVALSAFERFISPAYKKVFSDIFSTLSVRITDLGSTDPERTKNARAIINLVRSIPTDNREEYDVLGFIYEYLLKNFAANAGKAGEFYTPHEASLIMSEIIAYHLKGKESISIYDPTSGSGSLLINIGRAVAGYLGDRNKIKYYAQEWITDTYNLTRMNLIMRDILPGNIVVRHGDTLDKDWPLFEENDPDNTYEYLAVDACCSNPPYSQPWDAKNDARFDAYGLAPKSKADYAFLLHNLYHLKPEGIMTIVLPHGVLFRGGEEGIIRERLVKKHNIETIIGLPANLFFGTGIPTIIMVLKKKREDDNILFVDASGEYIKEGNKNRLRQRDVRRIVDTVIQRKREEKGFSRLVEYDEIEKNDFNLNIPRYVKSDEKTGSGDIYAMMFGGIPDSEIDGGSLSELWEHFPGLRRQLFESTEKGFSTLKTQDVKSVIINNEEISDFIDDHKERFSYLKSSLEDELLRDAAEINMSAAEMRIAGTLREHLKEKDLINYYDCFEILDDNWQNIAPDIDIIKEQGIEAAHEIDGVKILKKDSKTKRLVEKVIGNDGRIIPFEMIQKEYFRDLQEDCDKLHNELSELEAEKESLLESIDPADKAELLKDDESGEIVTKKLNAKIAEIKKLLKRGAEFEEDSYEAILLNINEVNTRITTAKKLVKEANFRLGENTEKKIKELTDDEIRCLLVKKWIDPICSGIYKLADSVIAAFEKQISELMIKYDTTLVDVESQIESTGKSLAHMIDDLTGNEYDAKGLAG